MKKYRKKGLIFTICFAMSVSFSACDGSKKEQKEVSDSVTSYGQIWSVPSTVKIKKSGADFSNKSGMELQFDAARNEYESSQLVITAEEKIDRFVLESSELSNGSDVLATDNIEIYMQKFIPYADYSGSGYIADALLPMEAADTYDENMIEQGNNGALWVTVYVPADTKAGTYSGNFTLTLQSGEEKEVHQVPVTLRVRDLTITADKNAETLFSWRYDRVSVGELDGSIEMMETYYEFFADYRISLQAMPLETLSPEEFVDNVVKYYDELSTYCFLKRVGDISGQLLEYQEIVKQQMLAVAEACSKDKNYFEKAMIYSVDEPNFEEANVRKNVDSHNEKLRIFLEGIVEIIEADKSGKYNGLKQNKNWKETITGIKNVIPLGKASTAWLLQNEHTEDGQRTLDLLNCICPNFDVFTARDIDSVKKLCEKYDIELWWYGCVGPVLPYPTYHIGDENLLSARTIGWLQKKYDVVGNLYWDAAAYTDEQNTAYNEFIDVYTSPYRISNSAIPAGDGFLAYPGAPYGVYGPLPSTRLMSIRDGMEEYELLLMLEKQTENNMNGQKADYSVKNALETYYHAIAYDGVNMYRDGENGLDFTVLRADLLTTLEKAYTDLWFVMGNVNLENETATFFYYTAKENQVTIDGEIQKADKDGAYRFETNLEEGTDIVFTVTDKNGESVSYKRFIAKPIYNLNTVSDKEALTFITVSDGSKAKFVEDAAISTDGTAVKCEVNGVLTGNNLVDMTFVPSASIQTALFGNEKVSDYKSIRLDVYNPNERFNVTIRLYSGNSYAEFGEFSVEEGMNEIVLNLDKLNFKQMDTADRISFEFVNAEDGKEKSYEFYVDNIVGEK